ncbi:hypothetical protein BDR06DRAFT_1007670 [Suillus hirtellus]|nr:hypothetical protein BDR06DRAFT_1007670 [Suillus hirtellus]
MSLESTSMGCDDDWNSLDHFDLTMDMHCLLKHFLYLRTTYNALQDGFELVQLGNWTYFIEFPGSNGTATELELWSISYAGILNVQNLTGGHTDQVWLLYSNQNSSQVVSYDCSDPLWISSPYVGGTMVRNLLSPYENYMLVDLRLLYHNNREGPWYECLQTVEMDTFSFKALVPISKWVPAPPMLTKFQPGHDACIKVMQGEPNTMIVELVLEFDVAMSCDSVTQSLLFNMSSSGIGGQPMLNLTSVICNTVMNPTMSSVAGTPHSQWSWSGTLTNVLDGILEIIVTN